MKKIVVVLMSILALTACNNKKPEKSDKVEYKEDYVIQESYNNNDRNINKKGQKLNSASDEVDTQEEETSKDNKKDNKKEEKKK